MISVTDQAKEMLDGILTEALDKVPQQGDGQPEPGLRLIVAQGQAGLTLDYPTDEDQVVEERGHQVLIMDPLISQALDGSTIDVVHTDDGDLLSIERQSSEAP